CFGFVYFGFGYFGPDTLAMTSSAQNRNRKTRSQTVAFCLSVLFFIALFPASISAQSGKIKLILDTDIGDDIDDAWALAFVISYQNFAPLGVTIAHGNTPQRAKIACKMLHVAKRDDIPVFVGRKTNDKVFQQSSWAEDFTAKLPAKKSAADFIVETVKRYP